MVVASETVTLPTRGFRIDPAKAFVVACLCWLGFAVMVWLVSAGKVSGIDNSGLLFWRNGNLSPSGPPWLLEGVRDVTALGGVILRNLFAIMAVVALLFLSLKREATLLGATIVTGWIVEWLIKHFVGRPRPTIVPHLTEAGGNSFPSGHSFNSACCYIAIALAFAALSSRHSVRLTVIATALVASLVIAWTRVWLGVHWPSDVIAGWLGGAGWAFLASALLYKPAVAAVDQAEEATEAAR